MIKLIVSDIDGTLVPDGSHEMNPELLDVIMKIRENGVQFAAASGRQWASIESIFGLIRQRSLCGLPWPEFIFKSHRPGNGDGYSARCASDGGP